MNSYQIFLIFFLVFHTISEYVPEYDQSDLIDRYDPDTGEYTDYNSQYMRHAADDHVDEDSISIFDDPDMENELDDFDYSDILTFDVPANKIVDLFEDVQEESTMKVILLVQEGGDHDIDFRILTPSHKIIKAAKKKKELFFSVKLTEKGTYIFEFSNEMSMVQNKRISFACHIDTKADEKKPLTEEHLDPVYTFVDNIEHYLKNIQHHQMYMKLREAASRDTAESTNSRVVFFTICSVILLFVVQIAEITYIQSLVTVTRSV